MPHVMVEGPCDVVAVHENFVPSEHRTGDTVLKWKQSYLSAHRSETLIEAVVVEGRRAQSFFVSLAQRSNGVMVKIPLITDPEKTDGVKRLVADMGLALKRQHPDCRFGQTNLMDYLKEEG
ncbi:MAG: hypothetical protein FJY97_09340 [candidate division Zixibacteria bacterium]|nr:hypothetical protein [candidate division Zixibacteria bacterium]